MVVWGTRMVVLGVMRHCRSLHILKVEQIGLTEGLDMSVQLKCDNLQEI